MVSSNVFEKLQQGLYQHFSCGRFNFSLSISTKLAKCAAPKTFNVLEICYPLKRYGVCKMNAIDLKRAEFRHYLENSGVMDALSYALIKLYDEFDKPSDPVAFVRQHFKRSTDETENTIASKNIEDLNANELVQKQEHELNLARKEIAKLRQMLNSMSSDSHGTQQAVTQQQQHQPDDESNSYQSLFTDVKYENSMIKKHLPEDLFKKLLDVQNEYTIIECIARADKVQNNPFGVVALNGNCYSKFGDLFEPIIKEIHCIDELTKHPDSDWGDSNAFENFKSEKIVSIEISCSRSLANMPFISGINEQNLEIILAQVQNAIQSTRADDKEIEGEFYKISDITETEPIFDELQKSGLGFGSLNPDEHFLWPTGRGIYVNCARTQSILINEEEHLRFLCKEMNGDFAVVYKNLIEFVEKFRNGLSFERSDRFGWITANLQTLGSGICCKIRLKHDKSIDCINEICTKNGIKVTSIDENTTDNVHFIELSNRRTFGVSEFECIKSFYDAFKEAIEILENNESIEEIPDKNVDNLDSKQPENSDETNKEQNDTVDTDENTLIEDSTQKNDEHNEVEATEEKNGENAQNVQNEQLTNESDKDQDEKPLNDENMGNSTEPNADVNENNTDNLAEGEKSNGGDTDSVNDKNDENEANPSKTNQNEANSNETEISDKPNDTEDQNTQPTDEQTTEG